MAPTAGSTISAVSIRGCSTSSCTARTTRRPTWRSRSRSSATGRTRSSSPVTRATARRRSPACTDGSRRTCTSPLTRSSSKEGRSPDNGEDPGFPRPSDRGRGGLRTCDLSRVWQRGARALSGFLPGNQRNQMPRTMIASSPIRSGTAALGPTNGPTVEATRGAAWRFARDPRAQAGLADPGSGSR